MIFLPNLGTGLRPWFGVDGLDLLGVDSVILNTMCGFFPCLWCPLSSTVWCPFSSTVWCPLSFTVWCPLSFTVWCPLSFTVWCPLSSAVWCPFSSKTLCPLSSRGWCPFSTVVCPFPRAWPCCPLSCIINCLNNVTMELDELDWNVKILSAIVLV